MKIINFGFNSWSQFWKRNQTLFYLLSNMEQVESALFINPGVWISEFLRTPKNIFVSNSYYIISRSISDKVKVRTPIVLPFAKKIKMMNRLNYFLNSFCLTEDCDNRIILILNDLQADRELVDIVRSKAFLTIFDWSDDFVEFSGNEEERRICEQRCKYYCGISDVILTINENLRARALEINANAYVVKNATNFFTFASNANEDNIIKRIRQYGEKVIGYIGWLNSLRLDLDLIRFAIEQRPEYQFVFLGPKSEKMPLGTDIPKMKNVHILPPVPYGEYPTCLKAMDVCILPNIINAHTSGNDPIKIYDYLASGRPVVATKTAGTEVFLNCLYLANDKYQFLTLLDQAVHEKSESLKQNRIETARQHSWQKRFVEVEKILQPFICR
ncbi:MAG: glycosyltransferase [Desulfuromonadales bacterium]|nr:glycosyltransferase [Desulfuromonadales bacterium]